MSIRDTVRRFLEETPLYTRVHVELPPTLHLMEPQVLELSCSACRASRPHRDLSARGSGTGMGGPPPLRSKVYSFSFACTGCQRSSHLFFVEVNVDQNWVRKVGQVPPWSISVSPELEEELGGDAEVYKRALVCLSQGFGLGACAYLRRFLENQVNPLLDLLIQVILEEGGTEEDVAQVRKVREGKAFDAKLEIAYQVAPASLQVSGSNPLKIVHDILSVGVHRLSEEECVQAASEASTALTYVVRELSRRREARREFVRGVKGLQGKQL